MPPSLNNYVRLGNGYDYLGQPVARVNFLFQYNALARESWWHFARQLLQSGLGRPSTLAPELKPASGGHLMGTTPMGYTESDSVVDGNCRVHGTENLYIAGSSVFKAGGASNPTYTIVAMALRLGDHLAKVLRENAYE
jgi:choline dehydrogenase-like flavoprotein